MTTPLRFCLVLHNHQPVGNFDFVFEQAYQESYLPFLNVFEPFADLRISLHTSGPLMEWLDQHHPEYLDRLGQLVAAGRIEILGGPFYEPILTMIPAADRQGQITAYSQWLKRRLGAEVQGMWMPERVWEASLATDIADAGISYTVLDDFHFGNAGLAPEQLDGYYLTEDQGRVLRVFPGSERLRYLIPFASPEETRDHLGLIHARRHGAVAVFADDGEKFGTWPNTHNHVYRDGWLERFFRMLQENRHWIETVTLSDACRGSEPRGRIYLPDASYREMTEWALPVERQALLEQLQQEFSGQPNWQQLQSFIRGGFWRNFKVKYPESNEMYARMMEISRRCQRLDQPNHPAALAAKQALYRGQCNCAYWHGAFGGIYLPHLRHAVYQQLIEAENQLDQVHETTSPHVDVTVEDFNFDGFHEIKLSNDRLCAYVAPAAGGALYELDIRQARHNVLATLARRPEAYHRKVEQGPSQQSDGVASIHDLVVFKQEGLDRCLHYDPYQRNSLIDHFFLPGEATPDRLLAVDVDEYGDFVHRPYQVKNRRNPDHIQVQLQSRGLVDGHEVVITKGIATRAGSSTLEIAYLLEELPRDREWEFAVEWNFSGLPSNAEGRYFFDEHRQPIGQLGTRLQLENQSSLGLADDWLGLRFSFQMARPSGFWTFPIETVSHSEGGFELVHQSVVVMPHWTVRADAEGRWSVQFQLQCDTRDNDDSQTRAATERQATVPL